MYLTTLETRSYRRKTVVVLLSFMGLIYIGHLFTDLRATPTVSRFGYSMEHSALTDEIDFYEYSAENEYLEITELRNIEPEIAEKLVKEKVVLFSSLYKRQRVGYKGQHTEFVDCADGYKPVYHNETDGDRRLEYFTGYSNDRFVFGTCDSGTSTYAAVNAFLYCSAHRRLLDIRYFVTNQDIDAVQHFIDRLLCENMD